MSRSTPLMSFSYLLLIAQILIMPPPSIAAAHPRTDQINFAAVDAYVNGQMQKHGLPGVALAVVQGDEIVYLKGYGSAGDHPMTPTTQMLIGSQSKSFTALAIMQLVEQGKIELDAPIQTYLPWFQTADQAASSRITVNHLLHHTSGLSENGYSIVLPDDATPEQAARSLAQARLTAPVGQNFQYFNVGYDVLVCLIETVSGQSYDSYIEEYILAPLEMNRSTADPFQADDLAQGYSRFFGFAIPVDEPIRAYEIGAGYIVSTADDLGNFAIAMNHDTVFKGRRLLSKDGARLLFTPAKDGYGMGWSIGTAHGTRHIWHGGANSTFRTDVDLYPTRGLAFVVLVNQGHQIDHFVSASQLRAGIEAIVLGQEPAPVEAGWSARVMGLWIGFFVLALSGLHIWNFAHLRQWRDSARHWKSARKVWGVGISFLIPTIILLVVFTQLRAFYGYRFNLVVQMINMPRVLPDLVVLMLVGIVPDYVQGLIKLTWVLRGQTSPQTREHSVPLHKPRPA